MYLLDKIENRRDRGQNATFRYQDLKQKGNQSISSFSKEYRDAVAALENGYGTFLAQAFLAKLRPELNAAILRDGTAPRTIEEMTQVGARHETIRRRLENTYVAHWTLLDWNKLFTSVYTLPTTGTLPKT